jgi:hypothetical protein
MRHLLLSLAVLSLLASTSATADPLDARCRTLGQSPSNARTEAPKHEAMMSLASCLAGAAMDGADVYPTHDSVVALDRAVQPAMQLLDLVIAHGDLEHRMLAEHTKGQLYAAMAVRVRSALPLFHGLRTEEALAAYLARVHRADALVRPWLELAADSFLDVSRLARHDPQLLLRNPVLANAVYDSRLQRAASIATR